MCGLELPDLIICGLKFGLACQKQIRRKSSKNGAIETPNLDNAWKLRGIYFIDLEDGEYGETIFF